MKKNKVMEVLIGTIGYLIGMGLGLWLLILMVKAGIE